MHQSISVGINGLFHDLEYSLSLLFNILIYLVFVSIFLLSSVAFANQAPGFVATSLLRVALDDNYPPYVMRRTDGSVEGYLIDEWKLWEAKTGVKVELIATDWAQAKKNMAEGRSDVIDTIFRTSERETRLEFSAPYATLPVSIYTISKLLGINDINGLEGFRVGVKDGDACVDRLRAGGITDIKPYTDYETLLQAVLAEKVHVFCMDDPPANYLIFRAGAEHKLLKAFSLYSGEFHRAVRKGDSATLALVESGFAAITAPEREALQDKWMGQSLQNPLLRNLIYYLVIAAILAVLLLVVSLILRHLVRVRTAALVTSQNKLQATLDALPDLLFEMDINGCYLAYHSPRTDLLALPVEHFLGKKNDELLPPEVAKIGMEAIQEAAQTGFSSGRQFELRLGGVIHWFELSVARKSGEAGKLPSFVVLSRDITSRKLAELQVARLTRLYAALSQCNQAIVRCTTEAELFTQICRDAVNFGGMKMAWIGLMDETTNSVNPVAAFGEGIKYLEGLEISLDANSASGRGPTGIALREDRPYWCQDFEQDPATALWHERAAEFGWKSSAALPLYRNNIIIGAFNLYEDSVDAFDEAAQNLLVEMATDISYALTNFAHQQARQQAEHEREQLLQREQQARNEADKTRRTISDIIGRISDGFVALDRNWCYTYVNSQAAEMFDRSVEQLVGKHIWTEFPEGVGQKFQLAYEKAMHEQKPAFFEEYYPPYKRWFENHIYPSPDGISIYFHDVTERKRIEQALRESEQAYRATFEQAAVGIANVAADGTWLEVNNRLAEIVGYTHDELLELTFQDITHPADLQKDLDSVHRLLAGEIDTYKMEKRYIRKSGDFIWIQLTASLVKNDDGSPKYFISVIEDIHQRKLDEVQLHKLSIVVEQSPNPIMITDLDTKIEYVNAAFNQVSGYSSDEALGKTPQLLKSGETPIEVYQDMWAHLLRGEVWRGELTNQRKDGSVYDELAIISPVRDANGTITNYLGIKENITEKKHAEARIQQLAYFDQLTGLPNRSQLIDRFNSALSFAQRNTEKLALMFLDLDHFKNINDTLGHSIGDKLLVKVAHRLKRILREEDTLSRLGGDEFILLLPNTEEDEARQIAIKLIEAIALPFQLDQYELGSTLSIGIAIYPLDGEDFETLLRNADTAMYRVKQAARNDFCFFTEEMQLHSARALKLLNALRHALARNELQLHYQPQIELVSGRVIGAEALLRWNNAELGMISPAEFIPIAEESGLILPIGEWVLRSAVTQMKRWMDDGLAPIVVAVNLSVVQFRHPNLTDLVTRILKQAGLPAQYLELELTEAVAMKDPQGAIGVMNRLHEQGIQMSIDDFGTGYSSLSYLKKFKIAKLKIDQSFVRDIIDDPDDRAIVVAIINLARSLGIQTLAEGVETEHQQSLLQAQGCDEVQGYYYSRPLPADQFEAYVRNKTGLN